MKVVDLPTVLTLSQLSSVLKEQCIGPANPHNEPCYLSEVDHRTVGVTPRYISHLLNLEDGMRSIKDKHGANLDALVDDLEHQLDEATVRAIGTCSVNEHTPGDGARFEDETSMRVQMTKLIDAQNTARATLEEIKGRSGCETTQVEHALNAIVFDRVVTLNGMP